MCVGSGDSTFLLKAARKYEFQQFLFAQCILFSVSKMIFMLFFRNFILSFHLKQFLFSITLYKLMHVFCLPNAKKLQAVPMERRRRVRWPLISSSIMSFAFCLYFRLKLNTKIRCRCCEHKHFSYFQLASVAFQIELNKASSNCTRIKLPFTFLKSTREWKISR